MLDLKKYSIKEAIDNALYGKWDSPLIIGTTNKKIGSTGEISFSQEYTHNGIPFLAWSNYCSTNNEKPNQEFVFTIKSNEPNIHVRSYHMHYCTHRYMDMLELNNCGYVTKIRKNGSRYLFRKRYEFKDRTLRMEIQSREYSWYYKSHRYVRKVNKNKTSEHYIHFKEFGIDIGEKYNSKGICTRSILHLHDGRSIQINLKNGVVSAFCQDAIGTRNNSTITLSYLKDASVLNLYDVTNCFNLDLMLPNNELFIAYTSSLRMLKCCIQSCLMNDEYVNPVLKTMLCNIEEYEKKN